MLFMRWTWNVSEENSRKGRGVNPLPLRNGLCRNESASAAVIAASTVAQKQQKDDNPAAVAVGVDAVAAAFQKDNDPQDAAAGASAKVK
jgi:hypothetical protein